MYLTNSAKNSKEPIFNHHCVTFTHLLVVTVSPGQEGIIGILKCHITSVMLNIDISCSCLFQHLLSALYCTSLPTDGSIKSSQAELVCLSIQYFKHSLHKRAQSLINSSFYSLPPDFSVLSNKVLNVMKDL